MADKTITIAFDAPAREARQLLVLIDAALGLAKVDASVAATFTAPPMLGYSEDLSLSELRLWSKDLIG